jgi:hypothetical protein
MAKRSAPVILKKDEISRTGPEVLIRPRAGTPDGPSVMLRTDPEGRSVLDVTCPCGRRFDLVLEEEEK